jgi:hypothetical protein
MKFLAVPMVLISLGAFAKENVRVIKISEPNGEVRIQPRGHEFAEFRANNPTCIEMMDTHVMPVPVAKSVRNKVSFTPSSATFNQASKGYCLYSFTNTFMSIALASGGSESAIEIYQDDNAPDVAEITCKRTLSQYNQLNCSSDGIEFSYNTHVVFNMKSKEDKEIKINMID